MSGDGGKKSNGFIDYRVLSSVFLSKKKANHRAWGKTFTESLSEAETKIQNVDLLDKVGDIDMYLCKCIRNLHWYLIARYRDQDDSLPLIGFEISANYVFKVNILPSMLVIPCTDHEAEDDDDSISTSSDDSDAGLIDHATHDTTTTEADTVSPTAATSARVTVAFDSSTRQSSESQTAETRSRDTKRLLNKAGYSSVDPINFGTLRQMTMREICHTAEEVRIKMGKYNVFTSNCQHFCNNLLQKLEFPTTKTMVGPRHTLC